MPAAFFNRFNDFRRRGLIYPSPFFDIAQTYMPPTVKELFKWCKYYFYTHPIINPVVYKMAEYPITEILYQEINDQEDQDKAGKGETGEPDEVTKMAYQEILEKFIDIKTALINCGLDYFTYGNCFVSISYPFIRMLKCPSCNAEKDIKSLKLDQWSYKNAKFVLKCPKCGASGTATYIDKTIKDRSELSLIRWDPENINISYKQHSGKSSYTYSIPPNIKKAVRMGKQEQVIDMPKEFLDAVNKNHDLKLNKDNFFHLKRCTLAEQDQGWGKPMILPAMRDAFYLQILRKANEAISLQYIVPLTVLFPQPHGNVDPYKHMNLGRWRERVESEIAAWKDDPNYIPIMPIPVGNQQVFGNGKALMVTPEIRALSEQMVTGMGVPTEFIFGGLSYSGSSVSLRIVENHLLRYREAMSRMLDFIVERIRQYTGLPEIEVKFQEFKMADDIQQQQLIAGFVQNRQISLHTGLQLLGFQFKNEEAKVREESDFINEIGKDQIISQAEAQGEASVIMAKYQAQAEAAMMEEQLQHQSKMLRENPAAGQMMMQQAQMGGMPPGGGDPAAAGAVPPMGPMEGQPPPDQTQQMTGPEQPQGEAVQPGYGHGEDGEMKECPIDPRLLALHILQQIQGVTNPQQRQQYMSEIQTSMPQLSSVMMDVLKRQKQYQTEPNMPDIRPPRRAGGSPL
jgi:hypothetical protein